MNASSFPAPALGLVLCLGATPIASGSAAVAPSIVLILADDIGYGDLGCYGATHVRTPNLDRLAQEGLRFMDAHAPASVCTPTRYSLLTGLYAWRRSDTAIAEGDAAALIQPGTPTLASQLKQAGYVTGVVGKWHLGLGNAPTNYNGVVAPGPLEIGFDSAFLIPATGDRVPTVYLENHHVLNLDPGDPIEISFTRPFPGEPIGRTHPELLLIRGDAHHSGAIHGGIPRVGYQRGGAAARWKDEDIARVLVDRATQFIGQQSRDRPFLLFLSTHDIHEPMVPHDDFRGSSRLGSRGDVIQQLDWTVGEVMKVLAARGLDRNSLVVFSSDNGGKIKDTYDDGTNALHAAQPPNGTLRGHKGQLYEGGHRVPLIVRWPDGAVPAGRRSDALVSLIDFLPSFSKLAGIAVPLAAARDARETLDAFLGREGAVGRDELVMQGNHPAPLALRYRQWKLVETPGGLELYNLADDPGETVDLASTHPVQVRELSNRLARVRQGGG